MIASTASNDPLIRDWFEESYIPLKLRTVSQDTLRLYGVTIRHFERFLGRPAKLSDFSNRTISRHLSGRRLSGVAPHTVDKERSQLLAMWRFACRPIDNEEPLVRTWPSVQPEKLPKRIPQAWLLPELKKLLKAASGMQGTVGKIRANLWWTAVLRVSWITGERIGALIALKWSQVDLDGGWIRTLAEERKGGRTDLLFELDTKTIEALRAIRVGGSEDFVFPWPYYSTYIWPKYTKLLIAAGLPTDRKSKFHRVRKTTASYFEASGGNATELLGHADRRTTKAYLDPRIVQRPSAAKLLPKV